MFPTLINGVSRIVAVPDKSTKGDLLTRDTMLLLFLSKRGEGLNISRIADELGYPDDSAVNKRVHELEARGLVRPGKRPLGWELTRKGREKIWPLTFPRYLAAIILVMSFGTIVWGINGLPSQMWVLVSGASMLAVSLFILYLYRSGEEVLLGQGSESESATSTDS